MKNVILIILVLLLNAGCKSKKYHVNVNICNPGAITSGHHVLNNFSDATEIIYQFYQRFSHPASPPYMPVGWVTISKFDAFGTNFIHCGLLTYFCYKEANGADPEKYFLAFKTTTALNDEDDAFPSREDDFLVSSDAVDFPPGLDAHSLPAYIESNPTTTCSNSTLPHLNTTEVNKYAGNFYKKILNIDIGAMENPVGFFHYDQIKALFDQTPPDHMTIDCMRIYWAYEESHTNSSGQVIINSDKIKIVAFAVLNDGKNYCYKNNDPHQGAAIILEKSWPPS